MIHKILAEINESNSTNWKLSILKKYSSDETLKRVLKMTYDTVSFTYGVTVPQIEKFKKTSAFYITLEGALNILETEIATRKLTGHAALERLVNVIGNLNEQDGSLLKKIINRDLRVNFGKTLIIKVFPDLIDKPVYMRCDVYGAKTSKNISYPAIVQLKADGTYREFMIKHGVITSRSRSGESYEYPVLCEGMKSFPDGVYTGELTVRGISDRSKGNGLINSDDPPQNDILLDLWDYIEIDEYFLARKKDKKNAPKTIYKDRLEKLKKILALNSSGNIRLIDTHEVSSLKEALEMTSNYMCSGFEGAILKDMNGKFKDGTSKEQLKLKLKIDCEMRITGFQDGTPGTKREGKIGSILFENDEGTIKGRTSGFSDDELDMFTKNQSDLIGKIMSVQFNDLTKAENNDYYALSHPRFIEIREDKNETDTLEKVLSLRDMAMTLE